MYESGKTAVQTNSITFKERIFKAPLHHILKLYTNIKYIILNYNILC